MVAHGLRSIDDLRTVRDRLQRKELNDLRDEVREKLLVVAEWLANNPQADVSEDFNEDIYDVLYKDQQWAEGYITMALGQSYAEENLPWFQDANGNPAKLDAVIKLARGRTMESKYLRESCGNFDYDAFLDKAIRHFHDLVGEESGVLEKIFILAGRTQAGKTSCKGVIQSLCGLLRVPLVILTKGIDESIDLHAKMVKLADGTKVQEKHVVVGKSKCVVQGVIFCG